jgi:type III restriction enzyme
VTTSTFIAVIDDGLGPKNPLNLVVEIKGYRGEDAKDKKSTMIDRWVPGVNALKGYGRWAFAEFHHLFEIERHFGELIANLVQPAGANAAA